MRSLGRSSSFWLALVTSHFIASPSQVASNFFPSQVASHFFASPSQVTSHTNSDSSPTRVQVAWLESTPLLVILCRALKTTKTASCKTTKVNQLLYWMSTFYHFSCLLYDLSNAFIHDTWDFHTLELSGGRVCSKPQGDKRVILM